MAYELIQRVYYEDTDAGGIVYYANYLKLMERARTEWLRALGVSQESLRHQGVVFVVTEATARYRRPARLDDELCIAASVERLSRTRLVFSQQVSRGGELLVDGEVTIACMSLSGKPCAIPANIRALVTSDLDVNC